MALKRIKRRRRASITSLIDVIFLLLLFFMLASTFSKFSELDISAAVAGDGPATPPRVLDLEIDPHHIRLDGKVLPAGRWHDAVRTAQTSDTVLALHVTGDVSTQRMTDILADLNRIPDLTVYVEDTP